MGIENLLQNRTGFAKGDDVPPSMRGGAAHAQGYYSAPSRSDPRPGGGDPRMTYTHRIPSPLLKREVEGPKRFRPDTPEQFVSDNLTKANVNFDFNKMKRHKFYNTAERILQALELNEEEYNEVLGGLTFSGTTDELGVAKEVKDLLAAKGYNFNIPAGTITGGKVETAIGPLDFQASQNVGDEMEYKIGLDDEFKLLPNLTTEDVQYTDKGLEGQVGYNKGILSTDLDLSDYQWQSMLEGDKAGIGFTGIGPTVSDVAFKLDPFSANYNIASQDYNIGVDQALNKSGNLRLKGDYDSDDKYNLGVFYKGTWGPDEIYQPPPQKRKTNLEPFLEENLTKLKTRLNESRGGILGAF